VRQPKAELRARVNGQLTLRYERTGLTSYAGLEFVRRWLHRNCSPRPVWSGTGVT